MDTPGSVYGLRLGDGSDRLVVQGYRSATYRREVRCSVLFSPDRNFHLRWQRHFNENDSWRTIRFPAATPINDFVPGVTTLFDEQGA